MISKERFVTLMEEWKKLERDFNELDSVAYRLFGTTLGELMYRYEELAADAISAAVDDDPDDWVGYFAFERNFTLGDCVTDADGHPIPTSTWGEVYDLIVGRSSDGGAA